MPPLKFLFGQTEDNKLVDMVTSLPCVYDPSCPEYKITATKENAWKAIAEHVDRSVDDCKKRWRNIKDTYLKRQRKCRRLSTSALYIKGRKWPLAEKLSCLDKLKHKPRIIPVSKTPSVIASSHDEEEDETDDEHATSSNDETGNVSEVQTTSSRATFGRKDSTDSPRVRWSPGSSSSKRRGPNERLAIALSEWRQNERLKNVSPNGEDDIDLFFKSIAMSVRKLHPDLINEAKMKSLQMVCDLERRN